MPALTRRISGFLTAERILGKSLLIAVSGGRDSMVLLWLLAEAAETHRLRLRVAHFHHGLRGRTADADAELVERTARRLSLPLSLGKGDVRAEANRTGQSIEMAGRSERHAFLAKTALRHRMPYVVLGHHADDQAELFLLRMLRGAGADGLGGMRPVVASPADPRIHLLRPLLTVTRTELAAYAEFRDIPFREDPSNQDARVLRNRVRMELLPMLERDFQPGFRATLLRTMALLRDDADYLDQATEAICRNRTKKAFEAWPVALQRRWLRRLLRGLGLEPRFEEVEALRTAEGQWRTLSGNMSVLRVGSELRLRRAERLRHRRAGHELPLGLAGELEFGGKNLRWEIAQTAGDLQLPRPGRRGMEYMDADRVGRWLRIRYWQRGDRFQPLGMEQAAKLQDIFVNRKVPREERRRRLLAVNAEGCIVWVEGLPPGENFKLTPETKRRLCWECQVAPA